MQASRAAAAGPLARAMRVVGVVSFGRVGPLGLFLLFASGSAGWAAGLVWGVFIVTMGFLSDC